MAYGNEIHYGVIGWENVFPLAKSLGLEIFTYGDEQVSYDDITAEFLEKEEVYADETDDITRLLREAHDEACARMGWEFKGYNQARGAEVDTRYPVYDTPWGLRETTPFDMNFIFDRAEMGEGIDDMTLGIGLSSRYFPTFLDMNDPDGGLYNIDLQWVSKTSEIAIEEIEKRLPALKNVSTLFVKEIHY